MDTIFTVLAYWFVVDFMHSPHYSKVMLIQNRKTTESYT
jgi:hypothetical protein